MNNNENSVLEYLKANNEVLFDKIVNALRKGKQVNLRILIKVILSF